MSELEPLDDDILALVQGAKEVPDLDPASRAAILAVTSARIEGGGGGGRGDGDGGGSGGGVAGAGVGGLALGKLGIAIALFVAGVAAGVAGDRAMLTDVGHAATTPATVVAPRASAEAANGVEGLDALSAKSLPDAPRAAPSASLSAAVARSGASAEAPSSRGLAAERALLDVARSALARGEAGEAIAATERHAREYPEGSLVEEREAIAVKALVALGRMDEARRRAHALEQRFPNGLTVRAVRAAVGETP